jgi:hypothetical protein
VFFWMRREPLADLSASIKARAFSLEIGSKAEWKIDDR